MSHWSRLKCDLKCSEEVLIQILLKINPEWARYMDRSSDNSLEIQNWFTGEKDKGYSIRIRGSRHSSEDGSEKGGSKDLHYADVGVKRNEEGVWQITVDPTGQNYIKKLQQYIVAHLEKDRILAQATENNWEVRESKFEDGDSEVIVAIDEDDLPDEMKA